MVGGGWSHSMLDFPTEVLLKRSFPKPQRLSAVPPRSFPGTWFMVSYQWFSKLNLLRNFFGFQQVSIPGFPGSDDGPSFLSSHCTILIFVPRLVCFPGISSAMAPPLPCRLFQSGAVSSLFLCLWDQEDHDPLSILIKECMNEKINWHTNCPVHFLSAVNENSRHGPRALHLLQEKIMENIWLSKTHHTVRRSRSIR